MKLVLRGNRNHLLLKTIILFFSVFSIHLKALPITPRIIVLVIVLLFSAFVKGLSYGSSDIKWVLKCCVVLSFTWFSMYINHANETTAELPLASAFNFVVFVGLFPILISSIFDNDIQFCKALGEAGSIQSIIVIISALSPSFRRFLQDVQDIDFSRYNYRIFGLGVAGAGGSIYLFCGLYALAYLIFDSKVISVRLMLLYILNFIAIALVGRTGFYAAIVMTCFVIVSVGKSSGRKTLTLIVSSLLIAVGLIILYNIAVVNLESDTKTLSYTFRRLWEGFSFKDSETMEKLSSWDERILPLSLRTIFIGTGIVRGYSFDGLLVSHDGGYAKRYMSIGLLMTVYSYIIYYNYIGKKISQINGPRSIYRVCVVIMIIIEYKEPFMYQLALPFTLLMIVILRIKSQKEAEENKEYV